MKSHAEVLELIRQADAVLAAEIERVLPPRRHLTSAEKDMLAKYRPATNGAATEGLMGPVWDTCAAHRHPPEKKAASRMVPLWQVVLGRVKAWCRKALACAESARNGNRLRRRCAGMMPQDGIQPPATPSGLVSRETMSDLALTPEAPRSAVMKSRANP